LIPEKNLQVVREVQCPFPNREVRSRYEIYVERYIEDVNMESLTAPRHGQDRNPAAR